MRKSVLCTLLVLASGFTGPGPAEGQIIDWIHRLSGPSMLGVGLSYSAGIFEVSDRKAHFRMDGVIRLPVGFKESTILPGHSLTMFSLQPNLEIPVGSERFEVAAGLAGHWFGGKGHDSVIHWSIPVFGQFRTLFWDRSLRLGLGAHYFPKFEIGDFMGTGSDSETQGVRVKTEKGEISFAMTLGFDVFGR